MTHRITPLDAARAWAQAYNTLSCKPLEPLLSEDVRCTSQWVLDEIEGREAYLDYLHGKLVAISNSDSIVRAELAETRPYPASPNPPAPCVVITQGEDFAATVLFEVDERGICRIDLCMVPPPETCVRSGEVPQ